MRKAPLRNIDWRIVWPESSAVCTELIKFERTKMAGLRKFATSSNITSLLKRQFSSRSILRAAAVDISNPAQADRSSEPLSGALAAKEKGPWKELNKEDKIACKYVLLKFGDASYSIMKQKTILVFFLN